MIQEIFTNIMFRIIPQQIQNDAWMLLMQGIDVANHTDADILEKTLWEFQGSLGGLITVDSDKPFEYHIKIGFMKTNMNSLPLTNELIPVEDFQKAFDKRYRELLTDEVKG